MAVPSGVDAWPGNRGVIVCHRRTAGPVVVEAHGDVDRSFAWASVSKLATALCVCIAVDEGLVGLDDVVAPTRATLRQLLSHAGGIAPSSVTELSPPGTRRIYSNAGIELAAMQVERALGLAFETILSERVLGPLSMSQTALEGSPASDVHGTVHDAAKLLAELMEPSLLSFEMASAMGRIQEPTLNGVLPGFGSFSPCAWGLGLEVKGAKAPHWTGVTWGDETVGHFGQAGGFLVVDPSRSLGVCTLSDEPFGQWAKEAWPAFLDEVLARHLSIASGP